MSDDYGVIYSLMDMLESVGMGKEGKPNTLSAMVKEICSALIAERNKVRDLEQQLADTQVKGREKTIPLPPEIPEPSEMSWK